MKKRNAGETWVAAKDPKTGERVIRCKFCEETYDARKSWEHVCAKPKPDPGPNAGGSQGHLC